MATTLLFPQRCWFWRTEYEVQFWITPSFFPSLKYCSLNTFLCVEEQPCTWNHMLVWGHPWQDFFAPVFFPYWTFCVLQTLYYLATWLFRELSEEIAIAWDTCFLMFFALSMVFLEGASNLSSGSPKEKVWHCLPAHPRKTVFYELHKSWEL